MIRKDLFILLTLIIKLMYRIDIKIQCISRRGNRKKSKTNEFKKHIVSFLIRMLLILIIVKFNFKKKCMFSS